MGRLCLKGFSSNNAACAKLQCVLEFWRRQETAPRLANSVKNSRTLPASVLFPFPSVSHRFALLLILLISLLLPPKFRSCCSIHDPTRTSSCSRDYFRFIAIRFDQASAPSYGGLWFSIQFVPVKISLIYGCSRGRFQVVSLSGLALQFNEILF